MESAKNGRSVSSVGWLTPTNVIVYGLLLTVGVLQASMPEKSEDFLYGNVAYFEIARSIIKKGFYGFNFTPETVTPPGLPLILVGLCATVGYSYTVLVRWVSVFTTLGFIASYKLLYSLEGRIVAAAVCLLLATSPLFFALATRGIHPDVPYFFVSMLTLLLAVRLDVARDLRARSILRLLCGVFLIASLLIRSEAIALLTGLACWLIVSFFAHPEAASRRLNTFIPILVLGIIAQAGWMGWAAKHEVLEWPRVEGYPKSYVSQLKLKDGNYPELGTASLGDIPSRVVRNANDQAVTVAKLLTRKEYVNPAWFSPLVVGPVLLILIGVAFSIWPRGGALPDWYFISHEAVYLLWPWYGETRFLLPIAPLALLYLWRGGKILCQLAVQRPRPIGAFLSPLCLCLAGFAGVAAWRSGDLQPEIATMFWTLLAAVSARSVWMGSCKAPGAVVFFLSRWRMFASLRNKLRILPEIMAGITVAALVVMGLIQQINMGRDNLAFSVTRLLAYPDILAGKWVRANIPNTAVVMARARDLVYHYSRRRVVWFPPSSDPLLLMEGIRGHNVEFIIVTERRSNYYLPPETVGFGSLLRTYPNSFRLVHEESHFRIFQFVRAIS